MADSLKEALAKAKEDTIRAEAETVVVGGEEVLKLVSEGEPVTDKNVRQLAYASKLAPDRFTSLQDLDPRLRLGLAEQAARLAAELDDQALSELVDALGST